jgi:dual specificity tyrosine-phosphorylation-regulated kinase 2/3/4
LPEAAKISGSSSKPNSYGYDDDKGDYIIVMHDHLAYRYEVLDRLGSGSFG